jgi:glycolate dehydrogenase FAD-binding subunit
MSVTANLAAKLAEAVGVHHVVSAPEELAAYAIDSLIPAAIARPASAAEVMEVVKFAVAEKLAVVPLGSRSKCEMGMTPARYDIALDMSGLYEVAHYDAGDMTLSIDAGMPLRELEVFLRSHGQFLPLGVPCFETTTAGGVVASGIDSVLRQQYGTARDFLIGAEFVDGTGQLCKSGGRVVKNVTGYDLQKLLIGSLGTLGVITRVNFRTFPLPASAGGHLAAFAKSAAALEYRDRIVKTGIPLTNLEMISPEVAKVIQAILQQSEQRVPVDLNEGLWSVYSAFEGTERVVTRISMELENFARLAGAHDSSLLKGAADETLGGMLREAFEWLRWAAPTTVLLRLAICGRAGQVIDELVRAAQAQRLRSALLLRSTGIVYFALFSDDEADLVAPAKEIYLAATTLAHSQGGYATVLHAPPEIKRRIAGACSRRDAALQQRVKKVFDPSGIFAPGRVAGGI